MTDISLTICTAYLPNDRPKFLPNIDLTEVLNKSDVRWRWVVIDNSGRHAEKYGFKTSNPRFKVIKGPRKFGKFKGDVRGSYQHAESLNLARTTIKLQKNHFLLVLDPDFYITRPNWIEETLTYMREHDLAFLGAPWHPRWTLKPRDFPCLHCLFIDLGKVWIKSIDFLPEVLELRHEWFPRDGSAPKRKHKDYPLDTFVLTAGRGLRTLMQISSLDTEKIDRWLSNWRMTRYYRCRIGTLRDTGIKLSKDYGNNPDLKTEMLTPVVSFKNGFDKSDHLRSRIGRGYEALFKPEHSYLPKSGLNLSEISFADHNLPDIQGQGWEEFFHNGEPFGFHIRSYFWEKLPDSPPPEVVEAKIRWILSEIRWRQGLIPSSVPEPDTELSSAGKL